MDIKKCKYKIVVDWKGKKLNINKIGEINTNRWGIEYEIIGYVEGFSRLRQVRFIESGYISIVNNYNIKDGSVTDYTHKTVCGVGATGFKNASNHLLYQRWANMLGRCYKESHSGYKSYGAKGCYVEDYLLNFKNYVKFVEGLDNYNLLKESPSDYHIDKDYKSGENKAYTRETLSIMTKEKNVEIENKYKKIEIDAYDQEGEYMGSFPSITSASVITGIDKWNISSCINGTKKTAGGYVWVKRG